jgi:hypothetical protein
MTFDYDDVKPKARTGLSIKVGVLAGIIWGLFLSAYYSFVPKEIFVTKGPYAAFSFAAVSATLCFIALIIFIFAWPLLIKAFREAAEESKLKRENKE